MSNYLIPIEELIEKYYDPTDVISLLKYAKLIKGKTLRQYLSEEELELSSKNKGDFGNLLEAAYFKVKNNNESRPDIPESRIEIKSGQVWLKKERGARTPSDVIKERLKISMIDYMGGFNELSLQRSHLWLKIESILLLLFHRDSAPLRIDQVCVYSDLLRWEPDEISQMSQDWLHIKNMVLSGKANDLSEGHTWYLGACTAGATSASVTDAPHGIRAKVRAFSLKNSYLNYKLGYRKNIKGPKVILTPSVGETLDDFILNNMKSYFGQSVQDVAGAIGRASLASSLAKSMRSKVARALLEEIAGKRTEDISTDFEQFRKAGVIERAVALEKNGNLKECISFPAFKWVELDQEDIWEDTDLYKIITSKFFFTVFQKTSTTMPILIGCFFWTMPAEDIELMKSLWLDTKIKVREGNYENFVKKSEHHVGHVRPHARDASDTYPTPQGGAQTKKSFWLNNDYIRDVIVKELKL